MNRPLLSICMPTYNRRDIFVKSYLEIIKQISEVNDCQIEYNISVNPSGDGTEIFLERRNESFVYYEVNAENIGADRNIKKAFNMAKGKYVWLIGDDDVLIDGTIKRVISILKKQDDIAWIIMNYGFRNKRGELTPRFVIDKRYEGYKNNGKVAILETAMYMEDAILFTSSNIFLNSVIKEVNNLVEDRLISMLYTYRAALQGSAYLIREPLIDQGMIISWKDEGYEINVRKFNESLLKLEKIGYTKQEVKKLIRYRMTHQALYIWFRILKKIFRDPKVAIKDYIWYFKLMPDITILVTLGLPFIAIFLIFRHQYRNLKRKKAIYERN